MNPQERPTTYLSYRVSNFLQTQSQNMFKIETPLTLFFFSLKKNLSIVPLHWSAAHSCLPAEPTWVTDVRDKLEESNIAALLKDSQDTSPRGEKET